MKTAKILICLALGLLAARAGFAQGNREEAPFADKKDPGKIAQLFPNPATDFVTVKMDQPQVRKTKFTLYTILGNTVEVESEIIDDFEIRFKVRDLNAGYYLLALNNEDNNYRHTFKILKR